MRKLSNLYASPNIIRAIELRRMRWAGHVAQMEEMRNVCDIFVRREQGEEREEKGKERRRDHLKT
jgi:hypothetical protein